MMKKILPILLMVLLSISLFSACTGEKDEQPQSGQRSYSDYIDSGKHIAVQAGDVYGDVARELFRAEAAPEYNSVADMLEALRMSRVDAVLLSHGYVRQLQESGMYSDVEYLWVPTDVYVNEAAPIFHTEELRDKYNEWFEGIAADGTWQEIVDRWIGVPLPAQEDIPQFELTGENGTLKMCDTGNYPPLIYFDENNNPTGFDVEIMSRFAQHMGMKLEITMMAYEAIAPYVASGKADMSACTLTVTDEREEGIIMGLPSVITQAVLIVPKNADSSAGYALDYTDLKSKTIGVPTGSICDEVTLAIEGVPAYYSEAAPALEDVRRGRIDGYMTDLSAVRVLTASPGNEDLDYVEIPSEFFTGPMGAVSLNQQLIDSFNTFLAGVKADGTLSEMQDRWLGNVPDLDSPMPDYQLTGENGVLKVATTGTEIPFAYTGANGQLKGYAIELVTRFAAAEGFAIEFSGMEFGGLIPSVVSGKTDFAIANVSITEERKKSVLFTDSIYDDQLGVVILKEAVQAASGGDLIEWLKTGIERNLITDNRWKMVVDGLAVTLIIAFSAQILGTVFGCFVCFLLMRKNRFVGGLGSFYCGLIHGTPIVVLLMITYYIIFGNTDISNVLVAVAAFTMVTGAGVAGHLKGAIETVDPVEIEAARSIGFSSFKAFLAVTLPQAVRRALPSYTNGFVELVKATAIVGYIAIQDLTRAGDIIRSRTYDAYFPLLFVALIYLIVTTVCVQLFKLIIKKINGGAAV